MPIRILPPEVASQIAAGEVVERPASVVKELVENALDAGADDIRITVKNAGRGLIEVSDNGRGIRAEEIHLTVTRHATSKLSQAEDLFSIETLGFRGEALASIASISRTSISSRSVDQELGASLIVEGGKMSEVQPFGGPVGTTVQVENLFFNVPARLKFLKTDQTERRVINKLLARYAIAYPAVRFRFVLEDFLILQTSGNGNRREVLSELYDPQSARQ
ncbi:MAG: ATP-binding protein, partial [Anaerolineales bacterium]|nr:ATP-binding protein [Anaerolineales bacterium]